MSLVAQSEVDIREFLNNNDEFGQELVFLTPDSLTTAAITGWVVKHHTGFDVEVGRINTKTIYLSISEKNLVDLSYPVRLDVNKDVNLLKHFVTFTDSAGQTIKYIITENYPDEFMGIIGLVCKEYGGN